MERHNQNVIDFSLSETDETYLTMISSDFSIILIDILISYSILQILFLRRQEVVDWQQ